MLSNLKNGLWIFIPTHFLLVADIENITCLHLLRYTLFGTYLIDLSTDPRLKAYFFTIPSSEGTIASTITFI
jgi:hypothetical protein